MSDNKSMLAAVYHGPGILKLEQTPKPALPSDGYLVRVLYSGLCGTDIKTYKQGHRMFTPPCVLGHEFCGQIEAAGANADATLIGKAVVCAPYVNCGECEMCANGYAELCVNKSGTGGAFAEYVAIDGAVAAKGMVVVDAASGDSARLRQMALAEPLACILNSVEKSGVKAGQNVLVMGAGPMGLIHVAALKSMGMKRIIVTDFNEHRGQIAADLGADFVNPANVAAKECIADKLGGELLHHIIVCVGLPQAVEEAFVYATVGTTVNIFGGLKSGSTITIDPNAIHYNYVKLTGSFGFTPSQFKASAALIGNGKIELSKILTHTFPLSDISEAFAKSTDEQAVKIVIEIECLFVNTI